MREVLYANILTIIGQLITFYSSTRKQKNQILIFQIVAMAVMSCGSLLLKGYSAIVMDAVAILRNLFSIFSISFKGLPIFFIVLSLILGYLFNNMGFIGYLPMIANVGQSIFVLNKNTTTRQLQLVFAFTSLCWGIYNVSIKSYAGAAFDFANMTSFLYNAFRNKEKEN